MKCGKYTKIILILRKEAPASFFMPVCGIDIGIEKKYLS